MTDQELTAAQKLRLAALKEAADYHARLAGTPSATAGAGSAKVRATAEDFVEFLLDARARAGITDSETPARKPGGG